MSTFTDNNLFAIAIKKHTGFEIPEELVTRLNGKPIIHIQPPAYITYAAQYGEITFVVHAYEDGSVRADIVEPVRF